MSGLFLNNATPDTESFFSATHLLNASVRHVIKGVIYQLSSSVTSDCLKLELAILGKKVENELLEIIESLIR